MWDYMPVGPFATEAELVRWIAEAETSEDPLFFAFTPKGEGAAGFGSFLRIAPEAGSIEVGFLAFLAGIATECRGNRGHVNLMMKWAFEAGYRRYEWKCDAAERAVPARRRPSRPVLRRRVPAGDGREGAQPRQPPGSAAIDTEWSMLDRAFRTWLAPGISTRQGVKRQSLRDLTRAILVAEAPSQIATGSD